MNKKMLNGVVSLGLLSLMMVVAIPSALADRSWRHDNGRHMGWRNNHHGWSRWQRNQWRDNRRDWRRHNNWNNSWNRNWNWNRNNYNWNRNNNWNRYNPYYTRFNQW